MCPLEAAQELVKLVRTNDTRAVAHFVVNYVENLISAQQLKQLSQFIGLVPPTLNVSATVAILRSSYCVGHTLPQWQRFLTDVRNANADNPKIDRLLIGLDKPYRTSFY